MRLAWLVMVAACSKAPAPVSWAHDEKDAFNRARAEHHGVMIDFTAVWSVPSHDLSKTIDSMLPELAERFVPLRIDVSDGSDEVKRIQEAFGATVLPNVVFVSPDGTVSHVTQSLDAPHLRDAIANLVHVDK
jgi:thiol:disulfide interchange protein